MNLVARFECPARIANLEPATAFAESFCAQQGIDRQVTLRLVLLIEELFTNTVVHGHGGDCDAPVQLTLSADPANVGLDYADTAPAFDPLARLAEDQAALGAELAQRPIGHLGIVLIARIATRANYQRKDGWNRLRLDLDRRA